MSEIQFTVRNDCKITAVGVERKWGREREMHMHTESDRVGERERERWTV